MSDKLKSFLESHYMDSSPEVLEQFSVGLKNSSGTPESLSNITKALFQVVTSHFESEQDKAAVKWIWKFIKKLQSEAMQPASKVKEALFFPDEQSERRLIHWLSTAKTELLVCVFTITNNNLRNALKDAHRQGLHVRVISDDECMKQQGSDVQALKDFGIEVEIDMNPHAHMHNKFVIIDKEILITGSFNWTVSAVHANQENLLVIHEPAVCEQYIDYFNELWGQFRPVEASTYPSRNSHRFRR